MSLTKQQEVELKVKRAAGFVLGKGWPQRKGSMGRVFDDPQPVQIKMHYGDISDNRLGKRPAVNPYGRGHASRTVTAVRNTERHKRYCAATLRLEVKCSGHQNEKHGQDFLPR